MINIIKRFKSSYVLVKSIKNIYYLTKRKKLNKDSKRRKRYNKSVYFFPIKEIIALSNQEAIEICNKYISNEQSFI